MENLEVKNPSDRLAEKHRDVLLQRSRYACWLAIGMIPLTIFLYNHFYYPEAVAWGTAVGLFCAAISILLLLSLKAHFIKAHYHLPLLIMFAFIANVATTANLQLTGGSDSSFFFPYFLIYFAIGLFFPGQWIWVLFCYLIPLGTYIGSEYLLGNEVRTVESMSKIIWLVDTGVIGFFGNRAFTYFFMRDMKNQIALEDANARLQTLDEMKSRFFSNITHEFRTPLVALSSTIQMIMEGSLKDSAQQEKLLGDSKAFLDDMLENVNDLLMLTRAQKGFLEIKWSELEIGNFIERTVKAFESAAKSSHNRIKFTNKLEKPLNIYTDRSKLKKVLNNLIGNALKFTKEGEVEIIIGSEESTPSGSPLWFPSLDSNHSLVHPQAGTRTRSQRGRIKIQVRDTGRGIPKEDLATIFDPFTQASNNPLREVQGTGLGLATVKEFVEKLSGEVSVESEVGKGSTFTVELPLGDSHIDKTKLDTSNLTEEDDLKDKINLGIKSFDEIDLTHLSEHKQGKENILLVEDNPQIIQILGYVLKDRYNLDFAKDGEEGLNKAKELKPDLVVADIMMPKKNGYELLHEIKKDPDLKMIPVIMLTSKADIESKIKGYEEGADEYLSKPFNNREILTRVKGLIERRKLELQSHQSGKLAALGTMIAGVAHHINNKINPPIQGAAILKRALKEIEEGSASLEENRSDMKEALEAIEVELDNVKTIVQDLLIASRMGSYELKLAPVNINDILKSALRISNACSSRQIRYHEEYDPTLPTCMADFARLQEVFMNLIKNAIDAIPDKGNIWIKTGSKDGYIFSSIRDDGMGITQENMDKIFDLFFTTKPVGQGTGLGLSAAHTTIQQHRGEIQARSKVGEGAEFIVKLPIKRGD